MPHNFNDSWSGNKTFLRMLGFFIVFALGGFIPLHGQPSIQASDNAHLNFGTIKKGDVVTHAVTIRNTGSDTLRISKVDVSCGCTGSMMSSEKIAPHDSGMLSITFNSHNFRGPVHKTVTVNSNASNQPMMVVEFEATIEEEISLSPDYLWFQTATVGQQSVKTLTITNHGKEAFQIRGFETDVEGISAVLPSTPLKPGSSAEVEVRFLPTKPASIVSGKITLSTSHSHQKELLVGIYGTIVSGDK
jgi:hypothetical protein